MMIAAYVGGGEALTVSLRPDLRGVLLWRAVDGLQDALRDIAGGIFAAAYVPFLAGFAILHAGRSRTAPGGSSSSSSSPSAATSAATPSGVLARRHPMAPSVSPKKSWEGFAGSVVACVRRRRAVGLARPATGRGGPVPLVGLAAAVTATVGDLTESTVKRDLGIKDMGSSCPATAG